MFKSQNILKNYWQIILLLVFCLAASASLLQPGYFTHHDDLQIMRIFEMDKCFKDGQIPCRWVPDMGYGYGYPLFNYYPVMPYYLGELIHSFGFSLIWSAKIDFILSFFVSAFTMYFLAKRFWGKLGGLASATFYLLAPYHSVDVYIRGAMAEGWSLAFAPLVFLSIYQLITDSKGRNSVFKNIIFLAVSIWLFLTSHNPLALVFSPIMAGWALIFIIKTRNFKSILYLLISGLWGLGLAAFFTLPVLFESRYVHIETLFEGYFNYLAHFAGLNQLFLSTFWGYGGSIWGPNDTLSFQIGWLHWGGLILSFLAAFFYWKKNRTKSLVIFYCFLIFWLATFLIHPRSVFIWEKITILQNIQFPWRILSVIIMVSSLAIGALFDLLSSKKTNVTFLVVALGAVLILYLPYFKIEKPIPLTDQEKLSGALWDLQRTAGIFDYLPKTADFPPASGASESAQVLKGSAKITNLQSGTNWLSFKSESTESAILRLPIFDFPNWKLFVDGKLTQFDNGSNFKDYKSAISVNEKNDLGQPTFALAEGKHQIYAKLYNTPLRTIANLISLVSLIALVYSTLKLGGLFGKKS